MEQSQPNKPEQSKNSSDTAQSPVIQEIILYNRIAAISMELARQLDIEPIRALQLFYESQTCAALHDKSTGLYLYGDLYIADDFIREKNSQTTATCRREKPLHLPSA